MNRFVAFLLGIVGCGFTIFTPITVGVNGASEIWSQVPFFQVPANGFWALNSTFGIGNLTLGVNYYQGLLTDQVNFPNNTQQVWNVPNPSACTTCSGYAYGYPVVLYGKSETGGNPFKVTGPWFIPVATITASLSGTTLAVTATSANTLAPGQIIYSGYSVADSTQIVSQSSGNAGGIGNYVVTVSQTVGSMSMQAMTAKTVGQLTAMTIPYTMTFGGNLNSWDSLIDLYVTTDMAGQTEVAEISFYPHDNFISGSLINTTCHTFASIGTALVGIQNGSNEIEVLPTNAGCTANRDLPSATVDFLEIANYLISVNLGGKGTAISTGFLQGVQYGSEIQIPASWNSAPYNGYQVITSLPTPTWNFLLKRDLDPAANDNDPMWLEKAA